MSRNPNEDELSRKFDFSLSKKNSPDEFDLLRTIRFRLALTALSATADQIEVLDGHYQVGPKSRFDNVGDTGFYDNLNRQKLHQEILPKISEEKPFSKELPIFSKSPELTELEERMARIRAIGAALDLAADRKGLLPVCEDVRTGSGPKLTPDQVYELLLSIPKNENYSKPLKSTEGSVKIPFQEHPETLITLKTTDPDAKTDKTDIFLRDKTGSTKGLEVFSKSISEKKGFPEGQYKDSEGNYHGTFEGLMVAERVYRRQFKQKIDKDI